MFGKYFDHDGCYFKYSKQYNESWFIELFLFLDAMSKENILEASLVWQIHFFLELEWPFPSSKSEAYFTPRSLLL